MDHNAIFVLTWACVAVFIATAIVTLLALIGRMRLGGGDGSRHDFYLKALFGALILEVVGISVTAYASSIKSSTQLLDATNGEKGVGAAPPAVNASQLNWIDTGTNADWGGRDYAYTSTSRPKYTVKETTLCDAGKVGYVATCWDARPTGFPPNVALTDVPAGMAPAQWCTYKDNQIRLSTPPDGKAPPGRVYICAQSVPR
jgi:hypothetical protein